MNNLRWLSRWILYIYIYTYILFFSSFSIIVFYEQKKPKNLSINTNRKRMFFFYNEMWCACFENSLAKTSLPSFFCFSFCFSSCYITFVCTHTHIYIYNNRLWTSRASERTISVCHSQFFFLSSFFLFFAWLWTILNE
jgi:hypothetical protein